ncbi:MAG: hypothetical protein ABJL67_09315 [Sulfitobacter sp.]
MTKRYVTKSENHEDVEEKLYRLLIGQLEQIEENGEAQDYKAQLAEAMKENPHAIIHR